jgi:hypothetical protein
MHRECLSGTSRLLRLGLISAHLHTHTLTLSPPSPGSFFGIWFLSATIFPCVPAAFAETPPLAALPPLPGPGLALPVDVDGDGVSTFGDQYVFNSWAESGGSWTAALQHAVTRGDVLDLSGFFASPLAALSKDAVISHPEDVARASASDADGPPYVAWFPGAAAQDPSVAAAFESVLRTDIALADALHEFLEEQPGLSARLYLDRVELQVTAAYDQPLDDRVVINGQLRFDGVPIEHAKLHTVFVASTGKPLLLGLVDLSGWSFGPSVSGLSSAQAIETALLDDSGARPSEMPPRLLFVASAEEKEFRPAWEVITADAEGNPATRYVVDAFDGSVLRKGTAYLQGNVTGTVHGYSTPLSSHLPDYPGNPPVLLPVPDLAVTIQPGNVTAVTAADGSFSADPGEPGPYTVTATLNGGPYILNLVDSPPIVSDQAVGMTGFQLVLNEPGNPNRAAFTAQLNAWQWVLQSRAFVDSVIARTLTPFPGGFFNCTGPLSPERTRLAIQVEVNFSGICTPTVVQTASYSDLEGGCPPKVLLRVTGGPLHNQSFASIICHEYGHHFAYEMTRRQGRLHDVTHAEGLADVFSSYVLGDPQMARGWHVDHELTDFHRDLQSGGYVLDSTLCTSPPWQPTTNNYLFPAPTSPPSPVRRALPFSGAWWDLRTRLISSLPGTGTAVAEDLLVKFYECRFGDLLEPISFAIADELLCVDDSPYFGGDNNPANGTPHMTDIVDAFVRRNLFLKAFRRGDANADGVADISDAQRILSYLFQGGLTPPCLDAADTNDDGLVNIADASFLLSFLFGTCANPPCPPPPAPGPFNCGREPAGSEADGITCVEYPPCVTPPVPCPPCE